MISEKGNIEEWPRYIRQSFHLKSSSGRADQNQYLRKTCTPEICVSSDATFPSTKASAYNARIPPQSASPNYQLRAKLASIVAPVWKVDLYLIALLSALESGTGLRKFIVATGKDCDVDRDVGHRRFHRLPHWCADDNSDVRNEWPRRKRAFSGNQTFQIFSQQNSSRHRLSGASGWLNERLGGRSTPRGWQKAAPTS